MLNVRLGVTKGNEIFMLNEYEVEESPYGVHNLLEEAEDFILEEALDLDEEDEEYIPYKEEINLGWNLNGPEFITSLPDIDNGNDATFILATYGTEYYNSMLEV